MTTLPPPPMQYADTGACILPIDLDGLWPPDDRAPIYAAPKGLILPPTCGVPESRTTPDADLMRLVIEAGPLVPLARFPDERLREFVFEGPDPIPAPVPLPATGFLLAAALVAVVIARCLTPTPETRHD